MAEDRTARIKTLYNQGKSRNQIQKETGYSLASIRKVLKDENPGPEIPTAQIPPAVSLEPTQVGPKATINAASMGRIWALAFQVMALRNGVGWQLDANEQGLLGQATADTFPVLPTAVAEKMVEWSAPFDLAALLVAVIMRRLLKIRSLSPPPLSAVPDPEVTRPSPPPPPPPQSAQSAPAPPPPPSDSPPRVEGEILPQQDAVSMLSGGLASGIS